MRAKSLKTVNLKFDMPSTQEALERLEREIYFCRSQAISLLKIIHGYGSHGAGGDIRIVVQKRLRELEENGQIRGSIVGENWSTSDETAWRLLQDRPDLKNDRDLGCRNRGISIVIL